MKRTKHASDDASLSFDAIAGYVARIWAKSRPERAQSACDNFQRNIGWDSAKLYQAAMDKLRVSK